MVKMNTVLDKRILGRDGCHICISNFGSYKASNAITFSNKVMNLLVQYTIQEDNQEKGALTFQSKNHSLISFSSPQLDNKPVTKIYFHEHNVPPLCMSEWWG